MERYPCFEIDGIMPYHYMVSHPEDHNVNPYTLFASEPTQQILMKFSTLNLHQKLS